MLALTDASGDVVERYDYDDYGAVTFLAADGTPLVDGGGLPVTSSPAGNVYCWGGLRLDAETGLHNDDGGDYLEPQTGRAVRGKVKTIRDMGGSGRPLPATIRGAAAVKIPSSIAIISTRNFRTATSRRAPTVSFHAISSKRILKRVTNRRRTSLARFTRAVGRNSTQLRINPGKQRGIDRAEQRSTPAAP